MLKDGNSGIKEKDVTLNFGISANILLTIIQNCEAILKQREVLVDCSTGRKWFKSCLYKDVDEAVFEMNFIGTQ